MSKKEYIEGQGKLDEAMSSGMSKITSSKMLERRKRFGVHDVKKDALKLTSEQHERRERLLAMIAKNAGTSSGAAQAAKVAPLFKSKKWTPQAAALKKQLSDSLPTTP